MGKISNRVFEFTFLGLGSFLAIVTRWIYSSDYLFHWDSVQFALALNNFDLVNHQPHPPGYILYIWCARLLHFFIDDANKALIAVGIIFTVLGLWGIFYLSRSVAKSSLAGYIAGVLYLANASVWFHGAVAEVYIVSSALAIITVWFLYRAWREPTTFHLVIAAVLLGLLGGFRQVSEVALLPLLLFVLISNRSQLKQYLMVGASLLVANLIWLVPLLINAGGLGRYLASLSALSQTVFITDFYGSGWWAKLVSNVRYQVDALKVTVVAELGILFLAAAPYFMKESNQRYQINWSQFWFWVIALAGPILLPLLTLTTNPGYILTPALLVMVLLAVGLVNIWQDPKIKLSLGVRRWAFPGLILALVGWQVFSFYTTQPEQITYISPALASIERHDEILDEIIHDIQANNTNQEAAVWISSGDGIIYFGIRHLQYYLSDVDIYRQSSPVFIDSQESDIWHALGQQSWFESAVALEPPITKLFVIREIWDYPADGYAVPIQLSNGKYLIYYDLTDNHTRDFLASNFNFSGYDNAN